MPTITAVDNDELEISQGVDEIKFIDALKTLPDIRDNRVRSWRHYHTTSPSEQRAVIGY
jgi:hypothetical protein